MYSMLSGFEILIPESHHIALKVEYNSCYQKEKRDRNVSGTREWMMKIFFYMLHCSHCTSDGPWQVNSVKLEDVLLSFKIWVSMWCLGSGDGLTLEGVCVMQLCVSDVTESRGIKESVAVFAVHQSADVPDTSQVEILWCTCSRPDWSV